MDIDDIDSIEANLNKYPTDINKVLSAILETEIENQAMLSVILAELSETDEKTQELMDQVNKKRIERLVEVFTRLSEDSK
ncbi:MAG: hypothetical protein JKY18_05420 [Flavobacteriales bacterium]|nr:hypothetical protein [Flavobacteriales bacterium]PCH87881.1 MAG: hypothetical protein COB88_04890 [Flavobacteriales bacterium]